MKKIPLTKPYFDDHELKMIRDCLDSGWVTQGPMVTEFERLFSELHGIKYSLATSSCSTALHLAAVAIGLKPGDEAIVPAYTWVTTANCVEYTGAKAVFADIDINTFNVDPACIEHTITEKTKAIVVVHLFGLSADMDPIMTIAKKYNLKVIEDAACAVGCRYDSKYVGGIGDVGCFSFHPRKIITTGEGGMATTNDPAMAEYISSLRNHGTSGAEPGPAAMPRPYVMSLVPNMGYNYRLSDIQGAVGIAQLSKLDKFLENRRMLAQIYKTQLMEIDELIIPVVPEKMEHTFQSYVVRIRKGGNKARNTIMDYMAEHGVWTRPGTHAVHRLGIYKKKYGYNNSDFPNAIIGEDETITLPLYYGMTENDLKVVVQLLKNAIHNLQ